MADTTATAFGIKFKNDFILRVQQKKSRLMATVRDNPDFLEGKYGYFDRIGPETNDNLKTVRHGDTPIGDANYDRRRLLRDTRNQGKMVDRSDIARMMKDPTSPVLESMRMLFNRRLDDYILNAATGNSYSIDQNDAATPVALPSGQIIATSSSGLTLAKSLQSMEILDANEVDDDEERTMVANAHQITKMLNTTQTTNQFYLQIQQLRDGKIDFFNKAKWVRSERLLVNSSDSSKQCLHYAKRGLGAAPTTDPFVRVSERSDKQYNWQIYLEYELGATRVEDECVVQINCAA